MGIVRWLRGEAGRALTVAAALLVVGMMAVPTYWPGLFGLTRTAPLTLAVVLLGVSLLDRFRPSRWFLLWALPIMWILAPAYGPRYRVLAMFQAACGTVAWVLLQSGPVRAHFRRGGGWLETFFREHGLASAAAEEPVDEPATSLPAEPAALPQATWSPRAPAPPAGEAVAAGTGGERGRAPIEPAHGWWSEP